LPRSSDELAASILRKVRPADLYVEIGLEANRMTDANLSGLKVRAYTNGDHLVLIGTLSPPIFIPCCQSNTQ
jgi:hypothetical protein